VSIPLRVLLIEDDPDDATLVVLTLTRGGYEPSVLRVDGAVAMSDALDREPWDIVISDYSMPSFDAPAALAILQAHDLDIPFIIVSGTVGEHAAVTSMKAGAHDYLNKNNLKRLAPAVARELQEARNRADHRRAAQALKESEARFRALLEQLAGQLAGTAQAIDGAIAQVLASLEVALAAPRPSRELDDALREAQAAALRAKQTLEEVESVARDTGDGRAAR
jgi:DNA-binding NtrC family response regulator